ASVSPLEYPLDELLITNWLSCGRGVEVHACGLVDRESGGHLFLGHSGAGKSTTTLLWKKLRDVRVLSDDRIILRKHATDIWMQRFRILITLQTLSLVTAIDSGPTLARWRRS